MCVKGLRLLLSYLICTHKTVTLLTRLHHECRSSFITQCIPLWKVYLSQVNYSLLVKVKCLGDLLVECEEVVSLEERWQIFNRVKPERTVWKTD